MEKFFVYRIAGGYYRNNLSKTIWKTAEQAWRAAKLLQAN